MEAESIPIKMAELEFTPVSGLHGDNAAATLSPQGHRQLQTAHSKSHPFNKRLQCSCYEPGTALDTGE